MSILTHFKNNALKISALLLVVVISCIYSLPNIYGEQPALQVSSKAGINIEPRAIKTLTNKLAQANIKPVGLQTKDRIVSFLFANTDQQLQAKDILASEYGQKFNFGLNLTPMTPHWLQAVGATPMKLGLDLRGGVHLLLDVDVQTVMRAKQAGDMQNLKKLLREHNLHYLSIKPEQGNIIDMAFTDQQTTEKARKLLQKDFAEYSIITSKKGQTHHLKAQILATELQRLQSYLIDKTISTINNRVNELGVSEAVIQRQGSDNISVDLPGIQDSARAKELLGKTATLKFHLQDIKHNPYNAQSQGAPLGSRLYMYQGSPVLLKNVAILGGDSITFATATMRDGRPAVTIRLGGGGESRFNQITGENVGNPLAVVYVESKTRQIKEHGKWVRKRYQQEKIINIATINSALGNNFEITGLDSKKNAEDLALLLRSGSLAAPVDIIQETTVGPSLGKANIEKGVLSLEVGSLLVILFMIAYYRVFGLVANFALILNIFMIVALLSLIGMTLTLPGIAGIVLTVGMAVDANVLINERIREELRLGMSPLASIKAGYERAFATIVDANVTTLIVAMILFGLGSGSVKGFAVTLTIGLLCSMLTSITFTRAIVDSIYHQHRRIKKLSIGI